MEGGRYTQTRMYTHQNKDIYGGDLNFRFIFFT